MFLLQDTWICCWFINIELRAISAVTHARRRKFTQKHSPLALATLDVTPLFYHVKHVLATIFLLLTPLFYHCPSQWCLAKVASVPNLTYSMGLLWSLLLLQIFDLSWNELSALGFFGFGFPVALLLTALFSFWTTFPFSDVNHYFFQIFIFVFLHFYKSGTLNQRLR